MKLTRDEAIKLSKQGKYKEAIKILHFLFENSNDYSYVNDIGAVFHNNGMYELAMVQYERAAIQGQATSIFNIGRLYKGGLGVKKNTELAFEFFKKAAELKYNFGVSELAYCYLNGIGVEKNEKEAIKILKKGLKLEKRKCAEPVCHVDLAYNYEYGYGVKKDDKKALKYYLFCVDSNQTYAILHAANILLFSKSIKNDHDKAFELLMKNAKLNDNETLIELSELYRDGEYVDQDYKLANYYLYKALENKCLTAILLHAENLITGKNIDNKIDLKEAKECIASFLTYSKKEKEDSLYFYNHLKQDYKDTLPWEELEAHPKEFLNCNNILNTAS